MSLRDITVASTTESQAELDRVVGIVPDEPVAETPESSEVVEETTETAPAPDTGNVEKKDKGKGRFSKRIDELTRERYEAQAEASRLREQLEQIQKQPKAADSVPKLATPEGAPRRADYASDEEWVDARTAWNIEQRDRRNAELERQQRDVAVHATYMERADRFTETHPDFNEVVNGIRISQDVGPGVQAAIMGRPNGEEVAYYLGQNPDVCDELSQMNPADAVAEIGAISVSLVPRQTSPTPKPRVPAPLTPVGGSSRVAQSLSDLDPDAYIAARRRDRLARARR